MSAANDASIFYLFFVLRGASSSGGKTSPIGPLIPGLRKADREAMSAKPPLRRKCAIDENVTTLRRQIDSFQRWTYKNGVHMPSYVQVTYDPMVAGYLSLNRMEAVEEPWHCMIDDKGECEQFIRVFRDICEALYSDQQTKGYASRFI